jgi:cytochrome b6-f complex iron-sulfur subunit
MSMNRREFIILTAAVAAGCKADGGAAPVSEERTIDAGPISNYTADGVYDQFRNQGFFVIRSGGKLFALSAICTHRACKLNVTPDHSFFCKCHGSTFDESGKVTKGPATRDLPTLLSSTDGNSNGELRVKVLLR